MPPYQSLTNRQIITRLWDVLDDPHLNQVLGDPAELSDNVRTIPQETLTPRQAVLAGLARALDRDPNLGLDAWGEWTERRRRGGAGDTSGA
jgi:hypothetical protein